MVSSTDKKKKAQLIVKEKMDFYIHFAIYIIVNIFIIIQWWWITGGDGFPWFITTLAGWGIGVLAHFIVTYLKVKEVQKTP